MNQFPDDMEEADPGLARERTKLAWTRSSVSFAAIGVLILKTRPLIGAPLLILSAVIWSIGLMRRTPSLAGVAPKRVLFVTICVLVVAAVALTLALADHSSHGLRLLVPWPALGGIGRDDAGPAQGRGHRATLIGLSVAGSSTAFLSAA
jgi:lysylphosphatidylglycerol synthetase-like protein (DUF2156 family)